MSEWTPDFGHLRVPAPTWAGKRPRRIALLGDFGGGALSGRLDRGDALARRKPRPVEFDTLDDALARCELALHLPIGRGGAEVEVPLPELDAFHPDRLYAEVPLFAELAGWRRRLNGASTFKAAASEVRAWASLPPKSGVRPSARSRGGQFNRGARLDDFARLAARRLGGETAQAQAQASLQHWLQHLVAPFVTPAQSADKAALVAAVDAALGDAMRELLHHPDFQNVESLWRGVDFLVRRLQTGPQLQVHLFDISAEEFAADLGSVDDLSDSALYELLVRAPSQEAGGGYDGVAGLYHFDDTPVHAELLGRVARVCAQARAPFITAIAPDGFMKRREPPHPLVQEAFAALRALPEANCLALLAPRFLLRHPYGRRSDPIASFAFEEFNTREGLRSLLWGHPALLALAVLYTRDHPLVVHDLPFHHVVDTDGDSVALPCTERLVNTEAGGLLRGFGINALLAHKGEACVRFAGLEAMDGGELAVPRALAKREAEIRVTPVVAMPAAAAAAPRSPEPAATAVAEDALEDVAVAEDVDDMPVRTAPSASPQPVDAVASASDTDPDLDALLASLEAEDTATAPATAEAGAGEEDVDPDLAALLKSLD